MRIFKTVDKLVLKAYIGPMLASFFIVIFVLMMNVIWRYIDELVGKGLSLGVVIELIAYSTTNMIPLGFPLATLFAAIMTMGNLGENYELLALKSAGVSLYRILLPVFFVTIGMAIASFFVGNNLVPYANLKFFATIYDVRQKKQDIEFKDGLFFNSIDNISIRVEKQDPETKLLTGILLYNTETDANQKAGNMTVIAADSGYIHLSSDKRFIVMDFRAGNLYRMTRDRNWFDQNEFSRTGFDLQYTLKSAPGYDFDRTDADLFASNAATKTTKELAVDIDSLNREVNSSAARTYGPLLHNYVFAKDTMVVSVRSEAREHLAERRQAMLLDSLSRLPVQDLSRIYTDAERNARNSRSVITYDESTAKDALNQLYRAKVEWHAKWALPVAVIVFFLIGAPLGAIIRKGGLGMPIVISVSFFVLYYVLHITGQKLAKEGTWTAFAGVWMPTMVLLPIAIYLTYKATNDSNLMDVDWYIIKYKQFKARMRPLFDKLPAAPKFKKNGKGKTTR